LVHPISREATNGLKWYHRSCPSIRRRRIQFHRLNEVPHFFAYICRGIGRFRWSECVWFECNVPCIFGIVRILVFGGLVRVDIIHFMNSNVTCARHRILSYFMRVRKGWSRGNGKLIRRCRNRSSWTVAGRGR
jgi:hypothetical protein